MTLEVWSIRSTQHRGQIGVSTGDRGPSYRDRYLAGLASAGMAKPARRVTGPSFPVHLQRKRSRANQHCLTSNSVAVGDWNVGSAPLCSHGSRAASQSPGSAIGQCSTSSRSGSQPQSCRQPPTGGREPASMKGHSRHSPYATHRGAASVTSPRPSLRFCPPALGYPLSHACFAVAG